MTLIVDIIVRVFFKILESAPEWLVGRILDRIGKRPPSPVSDNVILFASECGDRGIDLAQQRLLVSSAFGTYFAGLLERDHSYINLKGQIESPIPPGQQRLDPLQRIYWALLYSRGPKILVIAAEGGMGKSTLAAKIVRCLYAERTVDMILGDSAKTQRVDPISSAVRSLTPTYYDPLTFYERVCAQLGLPYKRGKAASQQALRDIRDRLEGRRAIIVVDNLETVTRGEELLNSLRLLSTRDTRIIVTTRKASGLGDQTSDIFVVHLKPLKDFADAHDFLAWHIRTHADEHQDLHKLERDIEDKRRVQQLLERTGGIPLLTQLVLSDIARSSWEYVEKLPQLFGQDLLDFLYGARWAELETLGKDGLIARHLLQWIAKEQYRGKKVTFDRLTQWAAEDEKTQSAQGALRLLHERFLVVNHDPKQGNFALFPSLVEFLHRQQ